MSWSIVPWGCQHPDCSCQIITCLYCLNHYDWLFWYLQLESIPNLNIGCKHQSPTQEWARHWCPTCQDWKNLFWKGASSLEMRSICKQIWPRDALQHLKRCIGSINYLREFGLTWPSTIADEHSWVVENIPLWACFSFTEIQRWIGLL